MKAKQPINERASALLKQLVSCYLIDGQPVASKRLAQDTGLDISSATIRNVMSSLEKKGLLSAPHTSAGRIPTEKGLRLFVDSLLEVQAVGQTQLSQLQKQLNPDVEVNTLVHQASELISQMTQMAGVVSVPAQTHATLRHIEFLALPGKRLLVIMVTNERDVQNKVLHFEREYKESELQYVANFLNKRFSGQDISLVRKQLLQDLERSRKDVDVMMATTIDLAGKALDVVESDNPQLIVQGKANLVRYSEDNNRVKLQHLFDMFDRKREILGLFDRCIQSEGVKIFIGQEAGLDSLCDCSVVTAPYTVTGKELGVIGVIGPARMNYNQVIPVVEVTAKLLGEALK